MPPEKRNHFLDAGDDDENDIDEYGLEEEVERGGRGAKRRKLEEDDGSDEEGGMSDQEEEDDEGDAEQRAKLPRDDVSQPDAENANSNEENDTDQKQPDQGKQKDSKAHPNRLPSLVNQSRHLLGRKNLVDSDKAIKKSGVVYLSRPPPYMKPAKLRQLLEPYGAVNRIFLAPEDAAAHRQRVRNGGNKKRLFTEGWVEFVSKKEAVAAVELLNGRTIGGKKGSYYRDDVWSLVYLKKFKWHHLTQTLVAENMERASRMRAEISKAAKENKEFVRNVEQSKVLEGMRSKAAAKRRKAFGEDGGDADVPEGGDVLATVSAEEDKSLRRGKRMTFKQVSVARKAKIEGAIGEEQQSEQVKRVLSKIF